ncbi:cytochrome P450 [Nemania sp. FL0031]|nr:cytochrome P450 [Nemania sp. FL0031]
MANESTSLDELTTSFAVTSITTLLIATFLFLLLFGSSKKAVPGAPVHGRHWSWEPTFWLQSRFAFGAHRPFVVKRYDIDITILPNKYLEELRLMSQAQLNASQAQIENLGHSWTSIDAINGSNLHIRALQNKLIPELPKYLDITQTELNYAWPIHITSSQEWQEVDIQQMIRMLVARMTAKVFIGYPTCREDEWLKLSIDYTTDIFTAAFTLHRFPPWTHPVVARLLPSRYRVKKHLQSAQRIFRPLMDKHVDAVMKRREGQHVDEEDTLLSWMMDHGTEDGNNVDKMATRQTILTFASIHTTSSAIINMVFDLCAYPEWLPDLREEIKNISAELGPIGSTPESGSKEWLARLEKLDSFFLESQRMNPPLLLQPLTLKDGTHIPRGSRICWAGYDRINDASVTPNPEVFDPMRSYRKRYASLEHRHKFLAGQTSPDNLAFGYGRFACPGRAFAVGEIKLILARLISQCDIRFPETIQSRPNNMYADENVFPDPNVKIMMRLREK